MCLPLSESVHVGYLIEFLYTPEGRGRVFDYHIWQLRKLQRGDLQRGELTSLKSHSWEVEKRRLDPALLISTNATILEPGMSTR